MPVKQSLFIDEFTTEQIAQMSLQIQQQRLNQSFYQSYSSGFGRQSTANYGTAAGGYLNQNNKPQRNINEHKCELCSKLFPRKFVLYMDECCKEKAVCLDCGDQTLAKTGTCPFCQAQICNEDLKQMKQEIHAGKGKFQGVPYSSSSQDN